ncbi:MAG: sensor histidine kinase [Caulobacterales bacterium]|jgi:signal transduction histidine kinase
MSGNDLSAAPRLNDPANTLRLSRLSRAVLFLCACLILQGAYWGALRPFFSPPRPAFDSIDVGSFTRAVLRSAEAADVAAATFAHTDLPYEDCCETAGYRAVRMVFSLDEIPPAGLGLYPIVGADNYRLSVNGSLIYGEGRMNGDDITFHGNVRRVFRIPTGVLKAGDNTIEIVLARNAATPYFFVAPPLIGDYSALRSAMAGRLFWLNDWFAFSLSIGIAISLLSLIVLWRSSQRAEVLWAFLLVAAWTAKLAYYQLVDPPISGEMRLFILYALVNFIPVAWLNFANAGNVALRGILVWLSLLSYGAVIGVTAAIMRWDLWGGVETIDFIGMAYSAALAILAMGLFLYSLVQRRSGHIFQHAFFFLCLSLIVADSVAEIAGADFGNNVNTSMPLLIVGFVAAFLAGNVRLFQSSAQMNALLNRQLIERTAELESAHVRERAFVRVRAHQEERQRILRDMHDGLGSQLMSLLLAARRGEARPEVLADGLQSVVDEMRLIIDSMDSVGESLLAALSLFRDRVKPRVEEAGFQFEWRNSFGDAFPDYGPRPTLQVFRILQEAVVNAMKHSGGRHISVFVEPQAGRPNLASIRIVDDGAGMQDDAGRGRGLASMSKRAESFGARIEWKAAAPTGVEVVLHLPDVA